MTISTHRAAVIDALSLITQISPEAWRAVTANGITRGTSGEVELQPQPLPPVERFQVAAAQMTHEFIRIAIESEIQGRSASKIISDMVDDWCPVWPRQFPHPHPVPSPEPGPRPNEGPIPDPWVAQTGRMVGARILAKVGSRLSHGELRTLCSTALNA